MLHTSSFECTQQKHYYSSAPIVQLGFLMLRLESVIARLGHLLSRLENVFALFSSLRLLLITFFVMYQADIVFWLGDLDYRSAVTFAAL